MIRNFLSTLIIIIILANILSCSRKEPVTPVINQSEEINALSKTSENVYILTAPRWKAKQTAAVEQAGGTVTFSHEESGIGVVTASAPDFLAIVLKNRAITGGSIDMMIPWQPPTEFVRFEETAITPGDETFFPLQWNMQAINAPAAWAAGYTGNGVRVAILDGGIDSNHPDLVPNLDIASSTSFVPGIPFNLDVGGFWHGTHVAGIVAAADNGMGVIGVAPEATLIGVKVLQGGSGYFSWIIMGVIYAATTANADIINMSIGATFNKDCLFEEPPGSGNFVRYPGECALLVAALNQAVSFASSQGVLVVCSAGNSGLNFDHSYDYTVQPAEASNGIAISATGPVNFAGGGTDFRRFASYSNSGHSLVHVAAPGGDDTLYPFGLWYYDMVLSTNVNGWAWADGTSMAAPAAAGVAALILERFPNMSVGALKNKLANTADDEGKTGHDAQYGRGFVNAYRACTE